MRLLAIILGSVLAVLAVVALTLPWWLGAALAWWGPGWGVRFGAYERVGYARFRLEAVEFERARVRVTIDHLEGDTPLLWLWRRATGDVGPVRAGAWTVTVKPVERPPPADRARGWVPLRERLQRIADRLVEWIPVAEVGPGRVDWGRGALTFASATWRERVLRSPELGYRDLRAAVDVTTAAAAPWLVAVRADDLDAQVRVRSAGAELTGEIVWLEQRAPFSARFRPEGWLPETAGVVAEDWNLPAARVRLGAQYATVSGDARAEWREGRWRADVAGEGRPRDGSAAPPLRVKLQAHGDRSEAVVEALDVALPGATATLSAPVAVDRTGRLQTADSAFTFAVDLAELPWIDGRGALKGEGRIRPGAQGQLAIAFASEAEELSIGEASARHMRARGELIWPQLELTEIQLVGADGDTLRVSGAIDLRARTLRDGRARGRLARATLGAWAPPQPGFEGVELDVRAAGPWREPAHEGRATATGVEVTRLKPLGVEVQWEGRGTAVDEFRLVARAGESTITAAGSADAQHVRFSELQLRQGPNERFALVRPAALRWRPEWQLEPLQLRGPGAAAELEVTGGEEHRVTAALRGISTEWLRDWVDLPRAEWTLDNLTVGARWQDGPAVFAAEGLLTLRMGAGRAAQIATRMAGDAEGIEVESLRIGEGAADIVTATGQLPVVLRPEQRPVVRVDPQAPFALNAMTAPNPDLWEQLSDLLGVDIAEPEARARLSGTLQEPRGEARFRAQRIAPRPDRFAGRWPRIEALDFHLIAEENGIRLDQFSVAVDDQQIRARGWLPFDAAQWRDFVREPLRFAERGEFQLEVPDADMAAVAAYFPTYVAPKGRAQIDVTLAGAEGLRGFVRLKDAMLRPLGPLGVVQEINAELRLEGRSVTVQEVTGRVGGQLVTLRGRAELPRAGPPQLDFSLRGENLPFVRRAGLLMRGDLDLALTTPEGGVPRLGGRVRLRDSLFLSDVRALIPSGTKSAETRPPYFAIETPPLNRWRLDVRVEGERFMRLRTPVFNGTASARVRLAGTLGEPQAVGEAIIDEGVIRLPFASFTVRQGQVRLTTEQPQPQLWVTAATRRYGYDLRLELTGTAATPNLTFSSSPPLEAEQVLLLVMTGQPPNNEIATTDRQRAARFGAFFGQSLLGSLTGDPDSVDRLTISSGENVSEQGRETYNIEYRLSDQWSLTGEYDEFDDYYGGIKWRFYTKGGGDDE